MSAFNSWRDVFGRMSALMPNAGNPLTNIGTGEASLQDKREITSSGETYGNDYDDP